MADNINEVQKLYVAYFSRPADKGGLDYWANRLATDPNAYQDISHTFSTSAEYKAAYAGMGNREVVNTVYQHLFGRAAESTGLDYWANLLDKGMITVDNVVTQIATGAQGTDRFAYNAKVAVSTSFTNRLDLPNEQKAYAGDHANAIAIEFIAKVKDLESASLGMDPGNIDSVISHIVSDAGLGFPGVQPIGIPEGYFPPMGH